MSLYLCSIASGSSGNCVYIGSENAHVIIDAGISGKKIETGLNTIGLKSSEIDGLLITHEHSDHIKGVGVLARRYGIPIYATQGTIDAILKSKSIGEIPEGLLHKIDTQQALKIKDLTIQPYEIPHDASEPVCYTIQNKDRKIGFATDLGNYNEYIIEQLKDSHLLFVEANHDINMLQVGPYPYYLKQRILGEWGHLSNESSGRLITELIHDGLKQIVLGHLSKENNFDELAYQTVQSEITRLSPYKGSDFEILVAKRDQNSNLIAI